MSKKQNSQARPDGEFIQAPRVKTIKAKPNGPLSKKVWGATADELLLDSVDLISELVTAWEGGYTSTFKCEHEDGHDSTDEEYEIRRR